MLGKEAVSHLQRGTVVTMATEETKTNISRD